MNFRVAEKFVANRSNLLNTTFGVVIKVFLLKLRHAVLVTHKYACDGEKPKFFYHSLVIVMNFSLFYSIFTHIYCFCLKIKCNIDPNVGTNCFFKGFTFYCQ